MYVHLHLIHTGRHPWLHIGSGVGLLIRALAPFGRTAASLVLVPHMFAVLLVAYRTPALEQGYKTPALGLGHGTPALTLVYISGAAKTCTACDAAAGAFSITWIALSTAAGKSCVVLPSIRGGACAGLWTRAG